MTHHTREVEETLQAIEYILSHPDQGSGDIHADLSKVLHHQLQKAREELAEEVRLLVVKYYKTDEFDEVGFLNELQAELDQDKKYTMGVDFAKRDHSELDQDVSK